MFGTIISDVKVKHSVLAIGWDVWKVQADGVMTTEPVLQLASIIKFQEGSNTPHQGEDVQALHVLTGQLPSLLLMSYIIRDTIKADHIFPSIFQLFVQRDILKKSEMIC